MVRLLRRLTAPPSAGIRIPDRAGLALPVVLFTVALASALSVSGAFVTRQLAADARVSARGSAVESRAEGALVSHMASWNAVERTLQRVGEPMVIGATDEDAIRVTSWATRLSDRAFWLVSEGESRPKPLLRRRFGALVRVDSAAALVEVELGPESLPD